MNSHAMENSLTSTEASSAASPAPAPSRAEGVTVIIPVFNEEAGIGAVVREVRAALASEASTFPVEILVVDDGSTDATAQNARDAGARVEQHETNLGYGAAIKTALRFAANDLIVLTDGDGTYPSSAIAELIASLARADMAVGARSGEHVNIPLVRRPAKWVLRHFAVFLAGKPIPDLNSGLRVFRRRDALRFLNLYPSGFSFTTTITLAYLSNDLRIHYTPIDYHARVGRSKLRPLRDTKNLFLTVVRSVMFFNPLRVCGPVAVALAVAGFIVLFFVRDSHGNVLDGTVSIAFIGAVQVMILGLLADLIARSR
ncbi:glycosyltransferase family 2 protein [candidate division BRC1 bacterium HGW-BRC1-1]|jgi:glycosyltransferase involved in cell wall biosynthesis|nr:MAG: glycosyltransferase family 2 protein [candidate division BRC1 bacterium HGW-BRC1-1]